MIPRTPPCIGTALLVMMVSAVIEGFHCYYYSTNGSSSLMQRLSLRKPEDQQTNVLSTSAAMRHKIIKRAALEFRDGMYGILTVYNMYKGCHPNYNDLCG